MPAYSTLVVPLASRFSPCAVTKTRRIHCRRDKNQKYTITCPCQPGRGKWRATSSFAQRCATSLLRRALPLRWQTTAVNGWMKMEAKVCPCPPLQCQLGAVFRDRTNSCCIPAKHTHTRVRCEKQREQNITVRPYLWHYFFAVYRLLFGVQFS